MRYWTQDETRVGLQTTLAKRVTGPSVKPVMPVQWPRQAFWLYGAVAPQTGDGVFLEYSHLDSRCFEHFLQHLAAQHPDYLNVIQVDGAPAHIAWDIDIPDNVILILQPPHSPELNPIERFWLDIKRDLKGVNFANLDDLRAAISEILENITPEWIASMTQYPFIMNALRVAGLT
ncbi:MAG: IS630 family transposase [Alkalinema sp. RL_2_19]|nr:IS630 family transposase [Alkalinema sp. RL_2_19]